VNHIVAHHQEAACRHRGLGVAGLLEAVAVLQGALPEIDRGVIARDVGALFSALAAAGVIVPTPRVDLISRAPVRRSPASPDAA
jgi:hypothetical protein